MNHIYRDLRTSIFWNNHSPPLCHQAGMNKCFFNYTTRLSRSPTLSWYANFFFSSCFFCLILKVEFDLPKQRNQWHFIFKTESLCSCLCFLNDHTLLWRKKVIFYLFFFFLALVNLSNFCYDVMGLRLDRKQPFLCSCGVYCLYELSVIFTSAPQYVFW